MVARAPGSGDGEKRAVLRQDHEVLQLRDTYLPASTKLMWPGCGKVWEMTSKSGKVAGPPVTGGKSYKLSLFLCWRSSF